MFKMFMKIYTNPFCRNMLVTFTGFKFYKIEKGKQELLWCRTNCDLVF